MLAPVPSASKLGNLPAAIRRCALRFASFIDSSGHESPEHGHPLLSSCDARAPNSLSSTRQVADTAPLRALLPPYFYHFALVVCLSAIIHKLTNEIAYTHVLD